MSMGYNDKNPESDGKGLKGLKCRFCSTLLYERHESHLPYGSPGCY